MASTHVADFWRTFLLVLYTQLQPKKTHFKNKYIYTEKQETINNLIGQKRAKLKSSERRSDAMNSGEDGVW